MKFDGWVCLEWFGNMVEGRSPGLIHGHGERRWENCLYKSKGVEMETDE